MIEMIQPNQFTFCLRYLDIGSVFGFLYLYTDIVSIAKIPSRSWIWNEFTSIDCIYHIYQNWTLYMRIIWLNCTLPYKLNSRPWSSPSTKCNQFFLVTNNALEMQFKSVPSNNKKSIQNLKAAFLVSTFNCRLFISHNLYFGIREREREKEKKQS